MNQETPYSQSDYRESKFTSIEGELKRFIGICISLVDSFQDENFQETNKIIAELKYWKQSSDKNAEECVTARHTARNYQYELVQLHEKFNRLDERFRKYKLKNKAKKRKV